MSDPITRLNSTLEGRYRTERELGEGSSAKEEPRSDCEPEFPNKQEAKS